MTSFMLYQQEHRQRFKDQRLNAAGISKTLGAEWKNLTKEQKEKYEKAAQIASKQYNEQLAQYNLSKVGFNILV